MYYHMLYFYQFVYPSHVRVVVRMFLPLSVYTTNESYARDNRKLTILQGPVDLSSSSRDLMNGRS